jgi:ADP-ribosylglycohydrolase/fructose-1,6-bisphosphatase/inositol monophosphatase family enzyme
MTVMSWDRALSAAVDAARRAAALLLADFHRPGGPRGGGDKAVADHEAEEEIRRLLTGTFPEWGYRGEETGDRPGAPGAPVWLVDPNDGTRDYLVGRRGSAVSIALVSGGQPVVGVVLPFAYPDDAGDLFTWREDGGPLRRNGVAVGPAPSTSLSATDTVLVSSKGDRDPSGNLKNAAPGRYRSVPSIAHRLALVAAGEAAAATSLFSPRDWDYAGGHALVRAAGGVLIGDEGRAVAYGPDGGSANRRVFGGAEAVARLLAGRPWKVQDGRWESERPAHLLPGQAVRDAALLSRAQGCLLGQVAGDNLGALVEFAPPEEIRAGHGDGPRHLVDGGHWNLLAGQPTDDSEMALALARAVVDAGGFDAARVKDGYRRWLASGPFDVGHTTRAALTGHPDPASQANGSLMRASPLGVLAHALSADRAAALARQDAALTHPHPVCRDATAAFVVAVAEAVRTGDRRGSYAAARAWAERDAVSEVAEAVRRGGTEAPRTHGAHMGWVLLTLQNAFFELLHADTLEEGVVRTVQRGGDTDTNAAVAGALLGAALGRPAVPSAWRTMVLSCHPVPGFAARPRPMACWPVDVFELAERLLLAGAA